MGLMRWMLVLSDWMVPAVIVVIILFGLKKKVALFHEFTVGAREGFFTVLQILPTLIGLMIAVGILRASGTLDLLTALLSPVTDKVGFPKEALPITFMRLVSSSASTGLLLDIFRTHGPDSFIGRFVSVMMSCTETIFYTMSVYFLAVRITKTRYTLTGALIANFAGIVASIYITEWVFGK